MKVFRSAMAYDRVRVCVTVSTRAAHNHSLIMLCLCNISRHRIKAIKAEAMRNKGWKQKLGCSGLQRLNEELSGKFNMAIKVEQFLLRRYLPSPSTKYLLVLAASQCSLNDFFFSMQLLDASKA